jgi:hypothetical protein
MGTVENGRFTLNQDKVRFYQPPEDLETTSLKPYVDYYTEKVKTAAPTKWDFLRKMEEDWQRRSEWDDEKIAAVERNHVMLGHVGYKSGKFGRWGA